MATVLLVAAIGLAACGDDEGPATAADEPKATGDDGGGDDRPGPVDPSMAGSAQELADLLGCDTDRVAAFEVEDLAYMAPVRSGVMADAVVCYLHADETIHIFHRPASRGPLTDEEISHAFTHPPGDEPTGAAASPDCSPWLILGENYVIQVGSDQVSADVEAMIGADAPRVEPTTHTPVSLVPPGPCQWPETG